MDFGDILDQWEKQSADIRRRGGKPKTGPAKDRCGAAPVSGVSQKKVNPISAWLRVNGVYDKDADQDEEHSRVENRRRLRSKRPDAVIDIHGLTRDQAWDALEHLFNQARERNLEKLLIIHGKGNHSEGEAVLKRSVREFIERCPFAGESGQEKATGGGSGTTWVIIKTLTGRTVMPQNKI